MFIHEELLAVIFRLANFGVLLFLCIHIFRRYILPVIRDQIQEQELQIQAIEDRHTELFQQEKTVERFAKEQQELCMRLKEKVHIWSDMNTNAIEEKNKEKNNRAEQLRRRVQLQEAWLCQEKKYSEVIPQAVQDAQDILQQTFQSTEKQQDFMKQLMQMIKQEMP